ncbi:hypothetical protein SAY86_006078 [Trapa natans]|uniref:Pseudouridine synthase I TruA alpha/beta domain-containing protein n=1 Tax=Trapa natans TaxID=22666 RepID=A0AAN7QWF5_TRANT|nr:hypothetical protein SAY86_006078 [Trapa natans]
MESENLGAPRSPPPLPPQEPEPKRPKMSSTATSEEEQTNVANPRKPRYKRRKIAIFFAYCGVGYQGMQKNPGAKTIEGDLEEALFLAGAVPEPDRGNSKRYDWARSARTDKGVSAVGQVVSGRFYVDPPGLIGRLNSLLPQQIRIFGYKRVTASFNAKKFCDRRRYVYLIPVFALDPSCHRDRESVLASVGSESELVKCLECSERGRKVVGLMGRRCFSDPKGAANGDGNVEPLGTIFTGDEVNGTSDVLPDSGMNAELNLVMAEGVDALIEENGATESKCCVVDERTVSLECKGPVVASEDDHNVNADLNSGMELEGEKGANESDCGVVEKGTVSLESRGPAMAEEDTPAESRALEADTGSGSVVDKRDCSEEEEAKPLKGSFCYGEKERERLNRILSYYVGTHNFHNFTTRTKAEDPSARRYIVSFDASKTITIDGIEFVKCEVVGQSFMLHQIRKMIGLAVAVMRNCAPETLLEKAFEKNVNINVPTAPEVGLYLDECFFSSYNQKWKESHEELSMEAYEEEAEEFKMKYIYSHIASTEHKEGSVALWLHSLNHRNYPDLNHAGDDQDAAKQS